MSRPKGLLNWAFSSRVTLLIGVVSGDFYFETFSEGMGHFLQCRDLDILGMVFDP